MPDPLQGHRGLSVTRGEAAGSSGTSSSIDGISDWQKIVPDEHHDWLEQRDFLVSTIHAHSFTSKSQKFQSLMWRRPFPCCLPTAVATTPRYHGSITLTFRCKLRPQWRDMVASYEQEREAVCSGRSKRP